MNTEQTVQLRVTTHAHQQYCARVRKIGRDKLVQLVQEQWDAKEYDYRRGGFVRLAGVWWVFERTDDAVILITCYGKTDMHIPKALRWAAKHNDRINLAAMI